MFPRIFLSLVTAPSPRPVTLDELKAFARIDGDDEDGFLDDCIAAATTAAEEYTRRAFITQSWKQALDLPGSRGFDSLPAGTYDLPVSILSGDLPRVIRLSKPPLISITSVTTYDTTDAGAVLGPSSYTADTAGNRLVLKSTATWPTNLRPVGAIEIVTSNGYGPASTDVPRPIRTAILMHAAQIHETRGQCDCELPPGCKQMLGAYRVMDL